MEITFDSPQYYFPSVTKKRLVLKLKWKFEQFLKNPKSVTDTKIRKKTHIIFKPSTFIAPLRI